MKKFFALVASVFLVSALFASAAYAQQTCGKRDKMVAQLSMRYSEETVALGVANEGKGLLEIFSTADGATFTIFFTTIRIIYRANGDLEEIHWSCIISSGIDFQIKQESQKSADDTGA